MSWKHSVFVQIHILLRLRVMLAFFVFRSEFANFDATPWKNQPRQKISIPSSLTLQRFCQESKPHHDLQDVAIPIVATPVDRTCRYDSAGPCWVQYRIGYCRQLFVHHLFAQRLVYPLRVWIFKKQRPLRSGNKRCRVRVELHVNEASSNAQRTCYLK